MERPEVIEQKIEELKIQLEESKRHYQYEFVCNSDWSDEMIGFFNIGNAKKILSLLYEGKELQYRHAVFGNFIVYMNPQKNRILVKDENGERLESQSFNGFVNSSTVTVYKSPVNEDTIMSFIVWHTGGWYLRKY